MKPIHKILLAGLATIWLFDTLGIIASNEFKFKYTLLAPGSFIIYTLYGFVGGKMASLKTGVLIAAAVSFFDSTIGWETSMLLHPNLDKIDQLNNNPTPLVWIITCVLVTGTGALCGLVGSWLARLTNKNPKRSE